MFRRQLGFILMPRWGYRVLKHVHYRLSEWYYAIRNRWFARYYLLDIKAMGRGNWHDSDFQLFHAVFQILVNFVENECAHLSKISYRKGESYNDIDPVIVRWQHESWWNKWRHRAAWNEKLGIAHLRWGISLSDPNSPNFDEHCTLQSEHARQTLELYLWYKVARPLRPDPYETIPEPKNHYHDGQGGFTPDLIDPTPEITDGQEFFRGRVMTDEYRKYIYDCANVEEEYEEEDTRKAQQVLAIRRGLWT
jgi:hypothetical protein